MKLQWQILFVLTVAASTSSAQQVASATQTVTLAAGVPLHIRTTRTVSLRTGTVIEGELTEPIYVLDRLVLPKGAIARGTIVAYAPVPGKVRAEALLNGDVTPLHQPVVNFTSLHIPGGSDDLNFQSHALIRDTRLPSAARLVGHAVHRRPGRTGLHRVARRARGAAIG
ncbi:MAG: hypothetical protein ABI147_14925 [Acidobacteriaceae bacterium]